ncbi:auxin-induced protein 5NG4, partial [Tanacetum coccineum]
SRSSTGDEDLPPATSIIYRKRRLSTTDGDLPLETTIIYRRWRLTGAHLPEISSLKLNSIPLFVSLSKYYCHQFSGNFSILLFHYDGRTSEWNEYEWSNRAIPASVLKQTKW